MMGYLLFVWALIGIAGFIYLYRRQLRRWWKSDVVNRNLSPHERWPEVLHWREGDLFEITGAYCGQFFLRSLTEDGSAFGYEGLSPHGGRLEKWAVSSLIGRNRSLRARRLQRQLDEHSDEYMDLIRQFNIAYAELQARDKKNGIAA